jgi:BRCT domain type II-containing protein
MSKRTWDTGVVKVIKRERKQAIALSLGGKCRKDISGRFLEVVYFKPLGVSVETR